MRLYKVFDILGIDKQNDKMMDKDTLYLLSDPKISIKRKKKNNNDK